MMVDILTLYSAGGGVHASGPIRSGATRLGRADRRGNTTVFYDSTDRRVGTAEVGGGVVTIRDATGGIVLRVRAS